MECLYWFIIFMGLFGLIALVPAIGTIITLGRYFFGNKLTAKETRQIIKDMWA